MFTLNGSTQVFILLSPSRVFLRSVTDRRRTTGPRSGGCENLTTLLMTFNEIRKNMHKLAEIRESEKMEREAAPPATKLTASRLDIWPLIIREVPDSVPLNLSSDSLFSTVLTLQSPTRLSPPLCFFVPLLSFPFLSPRTPCKYRSQNYITVLRLPPP